MKKEISPKSKILRKMIIGIAVYCGAYLVTTIMLLSFSSFLKYGNAMIGTLASLIAGFAAFLTITSDEKSLLFYNPEALFIKKPYFIIFVILTSYSLTVTFNFLFTLIPWDMLGDKFVVQDNEAFYSLPLYFRLISYVIIGPFAEEVLFRGIIFYRFRKILPLLGAALGSSVFFAIYHGNLMQGIYALIMGFAICLMMDFGGSFIYAYVFHVIANLISNLVQEYDYINNVVYSTPGKILAIAYLVVAIILCYVFKDRLTKKDKKC